MVLLPAMRSQLPRADAAAAGAGSRASNIEGLFSSYKEPDEDKIGPEGIMQLCADMGIDASDVRLLILAWQLRASEQGYFSHAEWVEGLEGLRVDTTQALLERLDSIKQSVRIATKNEPFKDFYKFAFRFNRTPGQKSLDIDTAKLLLPMVLPHDHPHLQKMLGFLEAPAGAGVKAFNEDQWNSFLLFSHQINEVTSLYLNVIRA